MGIEESAGGPPVLLRPWQPADAAALVEMFGDPEIQRWTPLPALRSNDEAEEWIESRADLAGTGSHEHYAVIEPGSEELAGGVNLFRHGPGRAEIGYFTAPAMRGRGIALGAVRRLTACAHERGVERIEALVEDSNRASAAVVERAGFELEGRLRRFRELHGVLRDMLVYAHLA